MEAEWEKIKGDFIDLKREAIRNPCYIAWIGAGVALGTLAKGPVGAVVGGVAGLIWASKTCEAVTDRVSPHLSSSRFLKKSDFERFYGNLRSFSDLSRDEAMALAILSSEHVGGDERAIPVRTEFVPALDQFMSAARRSAKV